jgi:hypothetical protein
VTVTQILINLFMIYVTQGTLVIRVLVVLGIGHSLHLLHTRLREEIRVVLSQFGSAILEVGATSRRPHDS